VGYVVNTTLVRRPIAAVFETATTAKYWPRWHPATLGVSGAIEHPVQLDEQIVERAHIVGPPGTATWTCVERDPPHRLVLTAAGTMGTTARIEYTFAERDRDTLFTRALTYHFAGPLAAVVEALGVDRVMQQQSAQAMINLTALLEAQIPASAAD
jgi:uncharacterized protein YndB with AHSA1/START domain